MYVSWEGSQKLLRFTNETANVHTGVLEIFPSDESPDCNGDGIVGNDRLVYQRIYQDANNDGAFSRSTDTVYRDRKAGCMFLHTAHNHWHFDNFSKYELRDLSGGTVVSGRKTSSCIEDDRVASTLPGTPRSAYYYGCDQVSPQGISVGWSDIYDADLPEQYVIITGVPDGSYCLVSTADPNNLILETDKSNNSASVRVRLSGNSVTRVSSDPCGTAPPTPTPTPTPSPTPGPSPSSCLVYDDTLHWDNWSWSTMVDTSATSPVYAGARSMAVTFNTAWAGLSLHTSAFDTSPYTAVQFLVYPGSASLYGIAVSVYDAADNYITGVSAQPYATSVGNGWYRVTVPLADLRGANMTITRVQLQEDLGGPQPTLYVDNLRFAQ